MPSVASHRAYFDHQLSSNQAFWRRFGRRPDFAGKRVLEVGCGHGALSVEMARAGADVYGVDLNAEGIEFARDNLRERYADVAARVRFDVIDVAAIQRDQQFDIAVSKDTFEHVSHMEAMCRAVYRLLKPGGQLWAGFSPLYWSPTGDHRRTGLPPILHAFLPQSVVLGVASRHHGHEIRCLDDIGLNGMSPAEFRQHARAAGFETLTIAYNKGDKPLFGFMDRLRRIRPLERFATVNIYAVLARPASDTRPLGALFSATGPAAQTASHRAP